MQYAMSFAPMIVRDGVPIVAGLIAVNEMGLPTGVPLELVVLLCGALAVHSLAGLLVALAALVVADLLGTTALYALVRVGGGRFGGRTLRRIARRGEEAVARWRGRSGGHDRRLVFVGRSLPLARMYISIGAGLVGIPLRDFVLGAIPGALVWAGTPLALGYLFHADVGRLAEGYARLSPHLLLVVPVGAVVIAAAWWLRHKAGNSMVAPQRRPALAPAHAPARRWTAVR